MLVNSITDLHFVFSDAPVTDNCLWLRRKVWSKSEGNNVTTQCSLIILCLSYTTVLLSIWTKSGFFTITQIFFPFEAGVILFNLLASEQDVTIPGWRRGAGSLASCAIFTLTDSLASRNGGFYQTISSKHMQAHAHMNIHTANRKWCEHAGLNNNGCLQWQQRDFSNAPLFT